MVMAKINTILMRRLALASVAFLFALVFSFGQAAAQTIEELQAQTANLEEEIAANEQRLQGLTQQIDSLENKVAELNTEISLANDAIELTELKLEELAQRLAEAEAELERQKGLLRAALRALYERRDASTVELLIASESFSDFINEQEYLERLQNAVKDSADKVIELREQIEAEQVEQERLLDEQQKQKNLLDGKRQEQQNLLAQTQGEEDRYRQIVNEQVASLEQAEADLAAAIAAQLAAGAAVSYGPVARGQVLGELGSTGFSTGPHIHFQVYSGGSTVNPYSGSGIINGYSWPLAGGAGWISQSYGCVAPAWYYRACQKVCQC